MLSQCNEIISSSDSLSIQGFQELNVDTKSRQDHQPNGALITCVTWKFDH